MQLITNCSLWFAAFVCVNNDAVRKERGEKKDMGKIVRKKRMKKSELL